MGVTVQILEEKGKGAILYCSCCGAEYSADASDYFWMDPDEIFMCETCEEELSLVKKQTSYTPI